MTRQMPIHRLTVDSALLKKIVTLLINFDYVTQLVLRNIFIQITKFQEMGCIQSGKVEVQQLRVAPAIWEVVTLKVKIRHMFIRDPKFNKSNHQDYILKIWIKNHVYEFPFVDIVSETNPDTQVSFTLNNINPKYGRSLNMQIQNIKKPQIWDTAYGLIDLDVLLQKSVLQHHELLYLNFADRQGGFIQTQLYFQKVDYDKIQIKLVEPTFKTKEITYKKLKLRINVGEEQHEFKIKLNKKDKKLFVDASSVTFIVPHCISEATLQILDASNESKNLLGSSTIDIDQIFSANCREIQLYHSINFFEAVIGQVRLIIKSEGAIKRPKLQHNVFLVKRMTSMQVLDDNNFCMQENDERNAENSMVEIQTVKKMPITLPPIKFRTTRIIQMYKQKMKAKNSEKSQKMNDAKTARNINFD